ncbi:MAG TPA: PQQ-binding-like beta-propeller repeat protein, partial [Pirellulaceae bacterium]|nr:PQQ-binding-like beta-propeller repeat protein [Pirellulaceae bacterium]
MSAAVREEATQALIAAPFVPRRLLLDVTRANDPESTWRARQVLDRAGVAHGRVLHAALEIAVHEVMTRNAASPEREQSQRLVLDFVDDAPNPDMARLWLQWFKPTSNASLAAEWMAAVARVDALGVRDGRARLDGNRLVSTGTRGLVLEFDSTGNPVWRYPAAAWSAERLVNGRTLLALLEEQRIVQVAPSGERLWEFGPVAATRAKPLANGHILATDYSGGRVLEINSERIVVWTHNMPDPCFDAERLPNGNTLIGCANLVREVTADGQTVHQWMIRGRLNGLSLTPDGHLLIANFGANEVLELDDDGQVIWKLSEPQPCDAWRLESGNTLVTTAQRSVEFDREGRQVRQWTTAKYG